MKNYIVNGKKFKITVSAEKWITSSLEQRGDYIYNQLIEQKNIDDNYYDVVIHFLERYEDGLTKGQVIIVYYKLRVNEGYNTLPECKERLEIGL